MATGNKYMLLLKRKQIFTIDDNVIIHERDKI